MLVYTDIENSTKAAAENPSAMLMVQEVHDRVMRQGIQRFAGYEICTQGDSFEVAFATAVSAVQFALWAQDQLKQHDWSREVLDVPQFETILDENEDVVIRGPRVRMGVHAAAPGTWQMGLHGYTHHTVFGGEAVDLIATVSDAGAGGQVILTKDAADALIPRIHKVDALLRSIGTFRVECDGAGGGDDESGENGVELELFDCQPLPTPLRPHRNFSPRLRKIEWVAPGRSLAVIPPPPALLAPRGNDLADDPDADSNASDPAARQVFVIVIFAEEGTANVPELRDALAGVVAQQAQLAGGYVASPDACDANGAVIAFRTDYGAAARFLAVLPVVLVWSDWPESAKKARVMESAPPMRTVRVKMAMHVSDDVREVKLPPEKRASFGGDGAGGEGSSRGGGRSTLGSMLSSIKRTASVRLRGSKKSGLALLVGGGEGANDGRGGGARAADAALDDAEKGLDGSPGAKGPSSNAPAKAQIPPSSPARRRGWSLVTNAVRATKRMQDASDAFDSFDDPFPVASSDTLRATRSSRVGGSGGSSKGSGGKDRLWLAKKFIGTRHGVTRALHDAFAFGDELEGTSQGDVHGAGTAGGGVTLADLVALASTAVEGRGVDVARSAARAASAGQVVLTREAFAHTQGSARMPAGAYPISLGTHCLTAEDAESGRESELYELVSSFLGPLDHPRLKSARVASAGYRQSPDPSKALAVCFVALAAPDRDSEVTRRALDQAAACLRRELATRDGYECKQPEPNKFTLAFSAFDDAVAFAGAFHEALLAVDWSEDLLKKPGCAAREARVSEVDEVDESLSGDEADDANATPCGGAKEEASNGATRATNAVSGAARFAWRGLHARIGIVHGAGSTRKPLNTGRADYFGALPNLAARVCAAARYGQTLVEPTEALEGLEWGAVDPANHSPPSGAEPAGPSSSRRCSFSASGPPPSSPSSPSRPSSAGGGGAGGDESSSRAAPCHAPRARGTFTPKRRRTSSGSRDGSTSSFEETQTLELLGSFALKGVSNNAVLAQVLPATLHAARAHTFDPPPGLVDPPELCAIPATSIADRRRLLLNQDHGWGGASGRWSSRARGGFAGTGASFVRACFGGGGGKSGGVPADVASAPRRELSFKASGVSVSARGGPKPSLPDAVLLLSAEEGRRRTAGEAAREGAKGASGPGLAAAAESSEAAAAPGGPERKKNAAGGANGADAGGAGTRPRPRAGDLFRRATKTIVARNRFEGARLAKRIAAGEDDFCNLSDIPTLEQERALDDRAYAAIGGDKMKGAEKATRARKTTRAKEPTTSKVPTTSKQPTTSKEDPRSGSEGEASTRADAVALEMANDAN